ncbi:hypothetical protein F4821DRAFT_278732 [Hypoxylon rubiginosum]|uniref:Uncharacterized protein n=1 Tax=Hypoxylon rubiginosum TaxID=110542 RepID=A0ACC0D0I0_9PEZI|nr:hypothetical protein F4821DRAFT_278732 [Hypoxylon rubiginosum]
MDGQLIKVYATSDGGIAHWANPRRMHLHKKTPAGTTVCCTSVTAGGIVKGRTKEGYWVTTHDFVPTDEVKRELHEDTNDGECALIGHVKHTTDELHFTLIATNDTVTHSENFAKEKDCYFSNLGPEAACLHFQAIKYQFRQTGITLLARTRYDEVIHGVVTYIPQARIRPSYAFSNGLITADFGGPSFPSRSSIEVGMWVYARRLKSRSKDAVTNEMLDAKDVGPYRPETFRYYPVDDSADDYDETAPNPNPLVLIGHVVEVQGQDPNLDGPVTVKIQGLYEVLERIVLFGI